MGRSKSKLIYVILTMVLVLTMAMPVSATNSEYLPTLTILNKDMPEVSAGQKVTVPIQLHNNSTYVAKLIEIKPVLGEDSPFMVDELVVKEEVEKLSPKKYHVFNFEMRVDKNAKEGVYPIPLKITYKNSKNRPFEQDETVYVRVNSEHLPVEIIINDVSYSQDPQPGEAFDMTLELKNTGSIAADNVFVVLNSSDSFLVTGNVTERHLTTIPGIMTDKVTYTLTPKEDLEAGLYPLKCTVKYINNYDESKTKELDLYIPVGDTGQGGKANLDIVNTTIPNQANQGEEFTLAFDVVNKGEGSAKDLQVTVDSEVEEIVPTSLNKQIIGTLAKGETKPVTFKFLPSNGVATKNYPIKITVSYKEGKSDMSFSRYAGININGTSGSSGTVPLMIVSDYAADPNIVNAGEEFDLALTLWNTNSQKSVSNMKVTLSIKESSEDSKDDVFTPVDGSNTLYVATLAPGEKTLQHLKFYTVPDAKARNYKIDVNFEYEFDKNGEITKGTSTDQIGIQVVQPAEIQVVNFNTDDAPQFMGKKGYIYISTNNVGNVKVKNLQATLSGDLGEETIFKGDLESGTSHDFKFRLRPQEMGTMNEKITISYKDTRGEVHTYEEEFTLDIMEAQEQPDFGDMMLEGDMGEMPQEEGKSKKPWIIAGGIIGGIVLIIIIIVLRKRKKKKELMFDEAL